MHDPDHTNDTPQRLLTADVPAEAAGERLDKFLSAALPDISRGKIQGFIRQGLCLVDDTEQKSPKHKLAPGSRVELSGRPEPSRLTPQKALRGELNVRHADRDLAVMDKPAGLTVHPAPGIEGPTLAHYLVERFPAAADLDAWRPGIVHRLDKDTSGLMVAAISERARTGLVRAFSGREVDKLYLALAIGVPSPEAGRINVPIGRDPSSRHKMAVADKGGREARSRYRVRWTSPGGEISLVAVKIATGRTHQIRVHLAHLGHPIVGDGVYGGTCAAEFARAHPRLARLAARQMLHAARLGFAHPATGEVMEFISRPPRDFTRLPLVASRRAFRLGVTGLPGSGKSYFCSLLAERGVPVFSADRAVAELYEPGADGWQMLRSRFGETFVPEDGKPVDKAALFAAMRGSDNLRREVVDLVHPLVRHRMEAFFAANERARVVAAEVPLLLEAGWAEDEGPVDAALCVHAPDEMRARLLARRGVDADTAAALDSWQFSAEAKRSGCEMVAENPGDPGPLAAEAERVLAAIRERKARAMRELFARLEEIYADPKLGNDGP